MRFFAALPFAALAAAAAVAPTPTATAPAIELEARVDSACAMGVAHARADGRAVGSIINSVASDVTGLGGTIATGATSIFGDGTSGAGSALSTLTCACPLCMLARRGADCENS
jgi:hypothetical protein